MPRQTTLSTFSSQLARAEALLAKGELAAASALLESTTQHHTGHPAEQARGLQLAATVARMSGELGRARDLALRALDLSPPASPVLVSTLTEMGEQALMDDAHDLAADTFAEALEQGRACGLLPSLQASLLRKQAVALAAGGQFGEAVSRLQEARALLTSAGQHEEALRTGVEEATARAHAGEDTTALCAQLRAQAGPWPGVRADLALIEAALGVEQKDWARARAAALDARAASLESYHPVGYLSASLTLATAEEALAESDVEPSREHARAAAYAALAVAQVTLSEVIGREAAAESLRAALEGQRARWGEDAFRRAQAAVEARRGRA